MAAGCDTVSILCLSILLLAVCQPFAQTTLRAVSCAGASCAEGPGATNVQVFVEPEARQVPVVSAIKGATRSVWVEAYLLTNSDVIHSLEEEANRSVDVWVLLETQPFGGNPVSPERTLETLTAAGVHAKAT